MNDKFSAVRFEFDADCEKAWQDEKTGKMYVRAVASDDGLDLQRDRMSTAALTKMASASKKGVPFLENHRSTFEFGKTVDGEIVTSTGKDGKKITKFFATIELDGEFPQARKLFKEVASGECKRQLSIGGKLNLKNRDSVAVEMTPSGLARTINDLDLDHIAATREKQAANPRTGYVEAIAKALDDAEKDGWQGVEISKDTVPQGVNVEDVKKGAGWLAAIGRLFGGGGKMNKEGTPTEEETPTEVETTPRTPQSEASSPPATAEKAVCPVDPQTKVAAKDCKPLPEKEVMKPEMKARNAGETGVADLVNDIAILLSKYNNPTPDAPLSAESDEEKEVVNAAYNALWTTRHLLAKANGNGAALGAGEQMAVSMIAADAPFAPRDLSGKSPKGAFNPDKATGDAAMAASAVTDSRRDIQVGGEIKVTTMTAKEALGLTMQKLREVGKLPQVGDNDNFGKSFSPEMLEKALGDVIEKQSEITKSFLEVAVEKMIEEQTKTSELLQKSLEELGAVSNDSNRRLAELEGRVGRVEKAGGVSQSGPRGVVDSTVKVPSKGRAGTWRGLFDKAAGEATAKY
jgi:hypothetical protein